MLKLLAIIVSALVCLIILVFAAAFIGERFFARKVAAEVETFFAGRKQSPPIITKEDLACLPPIVQKWLEQSHVVGRERTETVHLHQKAALRLGSDKPWLPAEADQYFTISEPGFIWKAEIMLNPLVKIVGRDMYHQGKGQMLIKVLSLLPVVDARGPEIDQGTLLRFLGEMSWFPSAAISDYLEWEEVDSTSARATMSYGGVTASGIFTFSEDGRMVSFTAKRYMENKGEYSLEDWVVEAKAYKEFNGIVIPNKLDVIWKLDTGDYHWFSCEITEIEYNF